jgi:hypothetical protein
MGRVAIKRGNYQQLVKSIPLTLHLSGLWMMGCKGCEVMKDNVSKGCEVMKDNVSKGCEVMKDNVSKGCEVTKDNVSVNRADAVADRGGGRR